MNGRAVVGTSHELDNGDLSGVRDMAKGIVDVINDLTIALGGTLVDEEGLNKSLVGYASGRSSALPKGFFVGGDGSFGGGAQYVGIEDEDMASAFAVRAFLDRALEEGTLKGVSQETQDTLTDTLDYADYSDLETFMADLDFLVTFEDFVGSLQEVTTALDRQVIEIDAAAKERADKEREYVRDFLEKANRFFGPDRESSVDDYRQDRSAFELGSQEPSVDTLPADVVTHDGLVKLISGDDSDAHGIPNELETFEDPNGGFGGWVIDGKRFVFSEDQGVDPTLRSEDGLEEIGLVRRGDGYFIHGDDAFGVPETPAEPASDPLDDLAAANLSEAEIAMRNYAESLIEQVGGFEDAASRLDGLSLKAAEGEAGIRALATVLEEAGFTAEEASQHIEDGVERMFSSLQEEFDRSLDEALDPSKAQLREAEENKANLIADATTLSRGDSELFDSYMERIQELYEQDVGEAGYTLNDQGVAEKNYTNLDEILDPSLAAIGQARTYRDDLLKEAAEKNGGLVSESDLEKINQIFENAVEAAGYEVVAGSDDVVKRDRLDLDELLDPSLAGVREAEALRDQLMEEAETRGGGVASSEDIAKIADIFETSLEDLGYVLDESGNAVRSFRDAIDEAVASLDEQIAEQMGIRDEAQRVVDGLSEVRRSIRADASLSTLSPMERLEEARGRFEALSVQATNADEEVAREARDDLGSAGREYLQLAREAFGSSDQYADAYDRVDTVLGETLSTAERELTQAEKQLSVLEEIRDKITPPDDALALPEDFNWGRRTEVNKAIYTALKAAGLETPTGFGNGQLTALREQDRDVDALVSAMGFASGGIMTSRGPVLLEPDTRGGVTHTPALAVFGEGRTPEAFVPLPDGRTIPVTLDMPANDHRPPHVDALQLRISTSGEDTLFINHLGEDAVVDGLKALRRGVQGLDRLLHGSRIDEDGIISVFGAPGIASKAHIGDVAAVRSVIYGEGRLPEAYVPSPDGRALPNPADWPSYESRPNPQREGTSTANDAALLSELRKLHSEMSGVRQDNERLHRNLSRALSVSSALGR